MKTYYRVDIELNVEDDYHSQHVDFCSPLNVTFSQADHALEVLNSWTAHPNFKRGDVVCIREEVWLTKEAMENSNEENTNE